MIPRVTSPKPTQACLQGAFGLNNPEIQAARQAAIFEENVRTEEYI